MHGVCFEHVLYWTGSVAYTSVAHCTGQMTQGAPSARSCTPWWWAARVCFPNVWRVVLIVPVCLAVIAAMATLIVVVGKSTEVVFVTTRIHHDDVATEKPIGEGRFSVVYNGMFCVPVALNMKALEWMQFQWRTLV